MPGLFYIWLLKCGSHKASKFQVKPKSFSHFCTISSGKWKWTYKYLCVCVLGWGWGGVAQTKLSQNFEIYGMRLLVEEKEHYNITSNHGTLFEVDRERAIAPCVSLVIAPFYTVGLKAKK